MKKKTGTLLHYVFYGSATREKQESWITRLLSIGCDPFAYHNQNDGCYYTPFCYMLEGLYYDLAMESYIACPYKLTDLKKLINLIDYKNHNENYRNILMKILYEYKYLKNSNQIIDLYVLSINLHNHIDKYNQIHFVHPCPNRMYLFLI